MLKMDPCWEHYSCIQRLVQTELLRGRNPWEAAAPHSAILPSRPKTELGFLEHFNEKFQK